MNHHKKVTKIIQLIFLNRDYRLRKVSWNWSCDRKRLVLYCKRRIESPTSIFMETMQVPKKWYNLLFQPRPGHDLKGASLRWLLQRLRLEVETTSRKKARREAACNVKEAARPPNQVTARQSPRANVLTVTAAECKHFRHSWHFSQRHCRRLTRGASRRARREIAGVRKGQNGRIEKPGIDQFRENWGIKRIVLEVGGKERRERKTQDCEENYRNGTKINWCDLQE